MRRENGLFGSLPYFDRVTLECKGATLAASEQNGEEEKEDLEEKGQGRVKGREDSFSRLVHLNEACFRGKWREIDHCQLL